MLTVARSLAKLPVALFPAGFRIQPVEGDEVAARLVELTSGEPARQVPDMGGPRVYGAADLLGGYLRATKSRRRPIVPLWLPEGRARAQGRRQPGSRAGRGPPELGEVPRGEGELAGTMQLTHQSAHENTRSDVLGARRHRAGLRPTGSVRR